MLDTYMHPYIDGPQYRKEIVIQWNILNMHQPIQDLFSERLAKMMWRNSAAE